MRDEWFCSGPEGRTGPLTLQQLKLALSKHFHGDDIFIWHESMLDWVRAGDFGGFDNICPADQSRTPYRRVPRPLDMDNYRPEDGSAELKKRRFSIRSVAVGLLLAILGCLVAYLGMIGGVELLTEGPNFNAAEIGALAGSVFFVIGGAIFWRLRYRVGASLIGSVRRANVQRRR